MSVEGVDICHCAANTLIVCVDTWVFRCSTFYFLHTLLALYHHQYDVFCPSVLASPPRSGSRTEGSII